MKKRKISILTFAKGDNYGAVLQAYALSEVLKQLDYDVEFIYYTWSTLSHRLLSLLTPLNHRFEYFRNKYLVYFSSKCLNENDLREAVKDTDICIVGSDQVWNPDITTFRVLHYFFDFVPDAIPMISYAASFGVDEWKWPELTGEISKLIKRFRAISVREDNAIKICKNEFAAEAIKVLDPTLLLGNFSSLLLESKSENYVLGFKFITSKPYYNLLEKVAKELGSFPKVMDMFPRDLNLVRGMQHSYFPSPQRWITNIANAKFVITDSFHALAFSLIFNREFIIIPTSNLKTLQGRMISLLQELSLENRIFSSIEEAGKSNIWRSKIDYKKVNTRLQELRKTSMQFIKDALSNI